MNTSIMVSDAEIYRYLIGEFDVGAMYISPPQLRQGDTNASFGVYEDGGVLKWHDFGLPRKAVGKKAIDLVMEMRGVGYRQALEIIEREIAPSRIGKPKLELKKVEHLTGLPYIRHREHNEYELRYWREHAQTKFDLIYESVYALDEMVYAGSNYSFTSQEGDPAFVYLFGTNPYKCKIYRPLNPQHKFRMFNCAGIIEGWESMMREYTNLGRAFDRLFITASTKDRMCWKKVLSLSESAVNPLSEKIWRDLLLKKDVISSLAKEIIIIFDDDESGVGKALSRELAEELGCSSIDVSGRLGVEANGKNVKDLARTTQLLGIERLREFYNSI